MHGLAGAQSLSSKNSNITFDLSTSAGMNSWTVNGINQLNQQWFWFRVGSTGPQLDLTSITNSPTFTQSSAAQMTAIYSNSLYKVTLSYGLSGFTSPSSKSSLTEAINFQNLSGNDIDLSFFMYSDFTLGGPDFVNSQNVTLGTSGSSSISRQTVVGSGASNNVAINSPAANEMEVAAYPQLYNELTTSNAWTLNNVSTGGPGHTTWAMEWDSHLVSGASMSPISITDTLQAPEPGVCGFAIIGLVIGKLSVNKRRKKDQRRLTISSDSVLLRHTLHTHSEEI